MNASRNWEGWFLCFEQEVQKKVPRIPEDRWVQQLRVQVTGRAAEAFERAIRTAERKENCSAYEAIRGEMLMSNGDLYHVKNYSKAIHGWTCDNRSAEKMYWDLLLLKRFYDRAKDRARRWQGIRFPEIPYGTLAFLYTEALPLRLRESLPPWDYSRSEEEKYFWEIYKRCSELEKNPASAIVALGKNPGIAAKAEAKVEPSLKAHIIRAQPPAAERTPEKKDDGECCIHCGLQGHVLKDCEKWRQFQEENPEKKRHCPKCLEAKHSFMNCKVKLGLCWGKANGTKTPNNHNKSVSELVVDRNNLPPEHYNHLQGRDAAAAAPSQPLKPLGNVVVEIEVNGKRVFALLDTGSLKTLINERDFPPETLRGYQPVKPDYNDWLTDASGNQIPTLGIWPLKAKAGEVGGCVIAHVVRGCSQRVVLGLDVLREVGAGIFHTKHGEYVTVGGWGMCPCPGLQLFSNSEDLPIN